FGTKDGRRIMVIALTPRQWRGLGRATGLADKFAEACARLGADPDTEAGRFAARDAIAALLAPWCDARTLAEIATAFAGTGVLWGPFQDFATLVASDPRCSPANPMFAEVNQPGIPIDFAASPREPPRPAPRLGEDTDAVLGEVLGLSAAEIGRLHHQGVV